MYKIVNKRQLSHDMVWFDIEAPLIAKKAQPGQFVILRTDEYAERIPLTMAGHDEKKGTITIVFQAVGQSTMLMAQLEEGDAFEDVVGPLGKPTETEGIKRVCVVGGGTGNALAYPIATGMHDAGIEVDMVMGFKNKDLVFLEDEFRAGVDNLYITTDDGSYGEKGFTTDKLKQLIEDGNKYDEVIAVGPPIMMKFICAVTKDYDIKTVVSLTALMIDGTGMCGGCRITVGGENKYVCVDGPEFDGQDVDWDGIIARNAFYFKEEEDARQHVCKITGGVRQYD
ncbi:MAG TPA: sulfide/dihydroorotate dehydrogenase-like FAD/NAD-binding protein [Anaerovoracaceae bacterium]|nr:sulfide/dihydroorotate dehydrogenase-like FAD/NAD-binding protein [Anaerovoracaceae bacterium]